MKKRDHAVDCENAACEGPYAPSGAAVCLPCAMLHDARPSLECKCADCLRKNEKEKEKEKEKP